MSVWAFIIELFGLPPEHVLKTKMLKSIVFSNSHVFTESSHYIKIVLLLSFKISHAILWNCFLLSSVCSIGRDWKRKGVTNGDWE